MIKIFDTTQDYQAYSADGLKSGEFCYVAEDKTAYFRTNNIDGEDKVYNTGGGSSVSTDTKITIGFRNTTDSYGIIDFLTDETGATSNLYLGETNLGTVATNSPCPSNLTSGGYVQNDFSIGSTPCNEFLNERQVTWITLNEEKTHTFATLPQNLSISFYFVAASKDGVAAPIFTDTSITLPSNIEGKNCILVYDFIPDTTNNTYFQLSEDNSFII